MKDVFLKCDTCYEPAGWSTTRIDLRIPVSPDGSELIKHFCGKACFRAWVIDNVQPEAVMLPRDS